MGALDSCKPVPTMWLWLWRATSPSCNVSTQMFTLTCTLLNIDRSCFVLTSRSSTLPQSLSVLDIGAGAGFMATCFAHLVRFYLVFSERLILRQARVAKLYRSTRTLKRLLARRRTSRNTILPCCLRLNSCNSMPLLHCLLLAHHIMSSTLVLHWTVSLFRLCFFSSLALPLNWIAQLAVGGCLIFPLITQVCQNDYMDLFSLLISQKLEADGKVTKGVQKLHQLVKEDNFNKFTVECILDTAVNFELFEE